MNDEQRDYVERTIIKILHKYGYEAGCVDATNELMLLAKNAYDYGFRDGVKFMDGLKRKTIN